MAVILGVLAASPAPAGASSPTSSGRIPSDWQRGVNFVAWNRSGFSQIDRRGGALTGAYRNEGVEQVVLTPTNYASPGGTRNPSQINRRWSDSYGLKNESDASIRYAACAAERGAAGGYHGPGGMSVVVKPMIDPEGFSYFRGNIDPQGGNLQSFWAGYSRLLRHYARLAIEVHASTLVIGTELSALTSVTDGNGNLIRDGSGNAVPDPADTARWEALIAQIRNQRAPYYRCPGSSRNGGPGRRVHSFTGDGIKLAFAANWDAMDGVGFWDDLDYVGSDFYWDGVTIDQSFDSIRRVEDGIQSRTGAYKPFVYTEIGYDGATDPAGVGLGNPDANRANRFAQAFAFWTAKVASGEAPWFQGFWWWDRYADGGSGPGGASQKSDAWTPGPAAQAELCAWQCD